MASHQVAWASGNAAAAPTKRSAELPDLRADNKENIDPMMGQEGPSAPLRSWAHAQKPVVSSKPGPALWPADQGTRQPLSDITRFFVFEVS